ncbi:putative electron transport oxidoreductase [Dunaliella salina]|uniref:Electron transfer flavoprotein subunit alpha n=1 Tax=Dunaliella salina TaxID=3046 RepID=A0ABQ7GGP2_DUNSA|nr:putative electron transport oxidoreductase [Dunaliella salina]|eukprot:KAF5833756.1 putative electron transport oxidoreductase [Dunaliella salina]
MLRHAIRTLAGPFISSQRSSLFAGARLLGTLVVAEAQHGGKLNPSSLSTITAAQQLGQPITALVMGNEIQDAADSLARTGITKVMLAQHEAFGRPLAEPMSALLHAVQQRLHFDYMLCSGSSFGKNLLPRAAALLGCQPLSDVTQILDASTFIRPAYAGNAILTMKFKMPGLRMMTVRSTSFPPASSDAEPALQEHVAEEDLSAAVAVAHSGASRWVSEVSTKTERPDLTSADVVVCGGRALKDAQGFKMLESLADALGGAVGASRAAVDAGIVSNDLQVGQTGKIVAPKLYLGIGVSGAIQHMAGVKDSKVIAVINTDSEAPMFQEADYGFVGDMFTAVPEMEHHVRQLKSKEQ